MTRFNARHAIREALEQPHEEPTLHLVVALLIAAAPIGGMLCLLRWVA